MSGDAYGPVLTNDDFSRWTDALAPIMDDIDWPAGETGIEIEGLWQELHALGLRRAQVRELFRRLKDEGVFTDRVRTIPAGLRLEHWSDIPVHRSEPETTHWLVTTRERWYSWLAEHSRQRGAARQSDSVTQSAGQPVQPPEALPAPPRRRNGPRRLVVNLARMTVTLDGTSYDVPSENALRWVRVLVNHPGEWISGSCLGTHDADLIGVRTDRLRDHLPEEIVSLIESETGKGSRLRPLA